MLKNKKAMIYLLFLSVVAVFVILPMLFVRLSSKENKFEGKLGQQQLEIIDKYKTGDQALYYLDQAAVYSGYQAIHELANNGGFITSNDCGQADGYFKYIDNGKTCYYDELEPIKGNFIFLFNNTLLEYLKEYHAPKFPLDYNYKISSAENKFEIIGLTNSKISIPIKKYGNYSISSNFKAKLDYNIADFGEAIIKAKSINSTCSLQKTENLVACAKEKVKDSKLGWSIIPAKDKDDRTLKFDLTSDNYFYYYDEQAKTIEIEPVTIKFALTLSDLLPKENKKEE